MPDVQLPVTYRSEIMRPVFAAVLSGDSCSLVGVGGCGKSNVSRHLVRRDVCDLYLGEESKNSLGCLVNCTKLTDLAVRSLHCLMIEKLRDAAQDAQLYPPVLVQQLTDHWLRAIESPASELARRSLEDSIKLLLSAGGKRVFFVFDDFDHAVQDAQPATLNSLRAVRDDFKGKLTYLAVTRRELQYLRPERQFEDLVDILTSQTLAIGPHRAADSEFNLDRFLSRRSPPVQLSTAERQRLFELSGNHVNLLKVLLAVRLDKDVPLMAADPVAVMRGQSGVEPQCSIIWDSLEQNEQKGLSLLATGNTPRTDWAYRLEKKGLVRKTLDNRYEIFSPVFADYVRRRHPTQQTGQQPPQPSTQQPTQRRNAFEPDQHTVRLGGRSVVLSDDLELSLFAYLYENRHAPATRQALADALAAAEKGIRRIAGSPEQRVLSYMASLKSKLDSPNQEVIQVLPDGSFRLNWAE